MFDDLWVPGINGEKDYIECFSGSSEDNPHLDQKTLKLYFQELTEAEREVRYYGKFARLRGLVIDTYDPSLSDIDPFPLSSEFTLYEGIDPHPQKPHAALWKAIDPKGNRYVVAELKCEDGIHEFGKRIVEKRNELRRRGALLHRSIADTSLNQDDPAFRMNLKDELCKVLRDHGESVMPQNAQKRDWLEAGITKVKDLYRPIVVEGTNQKRPTQYVFKNCTSYKYELTHYQWPKKQILENTKPIAKDNDLLDCDRYIESVAPAFQTPGQEGIIRSGNRAYQRLSQMERQLSYNQMLINRGATRGSNFFSR